MLSFIEARMIWNCIDKDWKDQTPEERLITKQRKFFLKIWDNSGPSLPKGQGIIAKLAENFPSDPLIASYYPLGKFKDLAGLSHETIYNNWKARFQHDWITSKSGKYTNIANVSGNYMMQMWKKEFGTDISIHDVGQAMSLMLFRGGMGMVLEDRAHKELAGLYKDNSLYHYTPASHEYEKTGIDGYSFWQRNTTQLVHKYSLKSLGALSDSYIMTTRNDGKTEPNIYAGYLNYNSPTLTYKNITDGRPQLMFGPPIKK